MEIATMLDRRTPKVVFIAEQVNGKNAPDTMSFLTTNGYHILQHNLSNQNGTGIWDRFSASDKQSKLDARADEIISDIRAFISSNSII